MEAVEVVAMVEGKDGKDIDFLVSGEKALHQASLLSAISPFLLA
ncbi:MAG: hypothetical protein HW402_1415 [Dehalococcoidales bacterium]|nr:hypothetical protein [Dehalococcoidales bacterium]